MRLPEPARSIAACVTDAVAAAQAGDRAEFQESATRLAALNPEQVGMVLGAVVRSLLEDVHPDGLAGDDVQAVLERCVRATAGWLPQVDPDVLAALLVGALGFHEPFRQDADGQARPLRPMDTAVHAPLLVADLLTVSEQGLDGYLNAAFAEIARAETMEMP
ncbi:hypothetical protein HC028_10855 [Planosporangium flavigriseum]|uniref:Uncharacterized protein n=1 Tax=Planosporangium flavigriseum TaxID=373681 RepID=A0A8J3PIU9_9ACTN|nr:hypothetical protein [Planosporangium flavigriseum]NJC64999.1 hypothetical protein [Planosporangium flavigriseum]GIG71611.1 hypothetical protein Pfl04_00150 [Planosporangium flavigriseum]